MAEMLMKWADIEIGDEVAIIEDLDQRQMACVECGRWQCHTTYRVENVYISTEYIELTLRAPDIERRSYVEIDHMGRLFCSGCGDIPEGQQVIFKVIAVGGD